MRKQLELFLPDGQAAKERGEFIISSSTDLNDFGNRYDLFVVRGDVVRGMSLLECTNADASYFNNQSLEESL